jgi:hypothetical protein
MIVTSTNSVRSPNLNQRRFGLAIMGSVYCGGFVAGNAISVHSYTIRYRPTQIRLNTVDMHENNFGDLRLSFRF